MRDNARQNHVREVPSVHDVATASAIGLITMTRVIETRPMDDLTGFQRDLLVVTAGMDAPNGLDIKDELESYYESPINHGRLYPNLDTLVDKGLIEKGQRDERTNIYKLTDRGRREIEARRQWENEYSESITGDRKEESAYA